MSLSQSRSVLVALLALALVAGVLAVTALTGMRSSTGAEFIRAHNAHSVQAEFIRHTPREFIR